MANFTYRHGIALLQLIVFPVLLVSAVIIWKRTGWKAAGKTWRYVITLSLLRIIGGICGLLTISNDDPNIYIAEAVVELIGIAPLILTYIGLLRQIDNDNNENRLHPKFLVAATVICLVGLILGIAGVSITDSNGPFHANSIVKAAMGIFLAMFAIVVLTTAWLAMQLRSYLSSLQKKFFLAIGLSSPFLLVRIIYAAMGDFTDDDRFSILKGDPTIYLCMGVLEEIIAVAICVGFGLSTVFGVKRKQFVVEGVSGLDSSRA